MQLNEMDKYFCINWVIGIVMLTLGFGWDYLAYKFMWRHEVGFNVGQILWCAGWGMWLFITHYYQRFYGK